MKTKEAHPIAADLLALLKPACEKIILAGSLRRKSEEVHDLDFVVIPKVEEKRAQDLFGEFGPPVEVNLLDQYIDQIGIRSDRTWTAVPKGSGEKIKKLFHKETGLTAELYIADSWNFGVLEAVRTGPAKIMPKIMTFATIRERQVSSGFYLHDHRAEKRDGEIIPCVRGKNCPSILKTDSEIAFFDALGIAYFPPERRTYRALLQSMQQFETMDQLGPKQRKGHSYL